MNQEKCINCGISHIPLYLGLDNRLHCADHIGMLVSASVPIRNTSEIQEEYHGQAENAENILNIDRERGGLNEQVI